MIGRTRLLQDSSGYQNKKIFSEDLCFPPEVVQACQPKSPTKSPKAGAFRPVSSKQRRKTDFARHYDRGDLPLYVAPVGVSRKLVWKVPFAELDYRHYLPIFFDGVREKQEPHKFIARQGLQDLLTNSIEQVIDVIPRLVIPIKSALSTKDTEIVSEMLKTLQQVLRMGGSRAGVSFVPYYRQILPTFRLFYNKNVNIGDQIYYAQHKRMNLGDLIEETLELFERYGGRHAFINIKYVIPTYESKLGKK